MIQHGLLALHIAAGVAGLVVGPAVMRAPKRRGRHTRLGRWYQAATAVLCVTAVLLVVFAPDLWWLALIAVATEAAALGGWWLERRRPAGWTRPHVTLMCGSYISFVTAFLVVNAGFEAWWAWATPTVVGTPWIAVVAERAARSPRFARPRTV
ncbi:MAG TPA: hypothetical protein VM618_09735 [Acidimicrobiia bacterium]|nr:hypothetical protein [Acidimicrobiia bacterium]